MISLAAGLVFLLLLAITDGFFLSPDRAGLLVNQYRPQQSQHLIFTPPRTLLSAQPYKQQQFYSKRAYMETSAPTERKGVAALLHLASKVIQSRIRKVVVYWRRFSKFWRTHTQQHTIYVLQCLNNKVKSCCSLHGITLSKVAFRRVESCCFALRCHAFNSLHRIASHCIALHCIALDRIASHCIALHCIASHCIALHRIASHCIALHLFASHLLRVLNPWAVAAKSLRNRCEIAAKSF
jgi:hypothetical protein